MMALDLLARLRHELRLIEMPLPGIEPVTLQELLSGHLDAIYSVLKHEDRRRMHEASSGPLTSTYPRPREGQQTVRIEGIEIPIPQQDDMINLGTGDGEPLMGDRGPGDRL